MNREEILARSEKIREELERDQFRIIAEKIGERPFHLQPSRRGRLSRFFIRKMRNRLVQEVRLIIEPASRSIYLEALKKGLLRVFVEAGAVVIGPGSPLDGGQVPLLAADEKGLTTRFADARDTGEGDVYQASPATIAASALTGQVTNPSAYIKV